VDSNKENKVKPQVLVVGLGPGDERLLTSYAKTVLDQATTDGVLLLRTSKHPDCDKYLERGAISLDYIYEGNSDRQVVYRKISDFVVDFAISKSGVVYAVPGSPVVGEDSVANLLKRQSEVDIELIGSISFLDLVFTKLKFDPISNSLSIVDGEQFTKFGMDRSGPILITQTYSKEIMSKIKLAISDAYDLLGIDELYVTVLHHLGLDDEAIFDVSIDSLDTEYLVDDKGKFKISTDHLTTLFMNLPASPGKLLADLKETVDELRQKCPWDKRQTYESLTKNIVEECYELVDAARDIETTQDYNNLIEELGDLLFFVLIYGQIGQEEGTFNFNDILSELNNKLILRHPHIFEEPKDVELNQFLNNWETEKTKEKNRQSVFDGIPNSLPSLTLLTKVLKKASATGIDHSVLTEISDLDETQKIIMSLVKSNDDLESVVRELARKLMERAINLEKK
jgi:tetrapyrrole methylase family protein/MazG family protein